MSMVIVNQLNGIASLLSDGIIDKSDAEMGMLYTVQAYFGTTADYADYIAELLG